MNRAGPSHKPKHHRVNRNTLTRGTLIPIVPSISRFPCTVHIMSRILSSGNSASRNSVYNSALTLVTTNIPVGTPITNVDYNLVANSRNICNSFVAVISVRNLRSFCNSVSFGITNARGNVATVRVSLGMRNLAPTVVGRTFTGARGTELRVLSRIVLGYVPRDHDRLSPCTPGVLALSVGPRGVNSIVNGRNGIVRSVRRRYSYAVGVRRSKHIFISNLSVRGTGRTISVVRLVTGSPRVNTVCDNGMAELVAFNTFIRVTPNGRNLIRVSGLSIGHIRGMRSIMGINSRMVIGIARVSSRNEVGLSHESTLMRVGNTIIRSSTSTRNSEHPHHSGGHEGFGGESGWLGRGDELRAGSTFWGGGWREVGGGRRGQYAFNASVGGVLRCLSGPCVYGGRN